jgi:chemotaxis protein CheZ
MAERADRQELLELCQKVIGAGEARAAGVANPDPREQMANILKEIHELSRILTDARADLASFHAKEINRNHIPSAHQELDAIASQTAFATNEILDACETIEPLSERLDEQAATRILSATMRIYTACGFQDLVGQRIRKVLRTLTTIDVKVEHIIQTFGDAVLFGEELQDTESHNADRLMNGPQLPDVAMHQSDIDRLLAGD